MGNAVSTPSESDRVIRKNFEGAVQYPMRCSAIRPELSRKRLPLFFPGRIRAVLRDLGF
jgi:hypothetical protein